MNLPKLFLRRAPAAFALCAGFFLIPAGRAQPGPQIADSRYLFIFDTSADMKKRLPAAQAEVNELLSTSMGGQLRAGDSIGVWTFDQDLRAGQFPLQHWKPEDARTIASGINKFLGKQRCANRTRFDALQPQLNQVIQSSERLTVLIFCDGGDEIKWTPYDTGINQVFQQRLAEQQKTRQPFVLVLRAQLGQYIGCTMNFPPGMVRIPDFPPPPPPPPAPISTPPPAPVVKPPTGPPLIIIGTKVETNWPPATNAAPAAPASVVPAAPTNPAAPPAPMTSTNAFPAAPANPVAPPPPVQTIATPAPPASSFAPTNSTAPKNLTAPPLPVNSAPVTQTNAAAAPRTNSSQPAINAPAAETDLVPIPHSNQTAPTNAAAQSPETSSLSHKKSLVIGAALLIAAAALVVLAVFRGRRTDRGSLITRSMKKD